MPDVFRLRLRTRVLGAMLLAWLCLSGSLLAEDQQASGAAEAFDLEDDYLIRSWTTADGLPVNHIDGIVQTEDGYLWLATGGGLVRFNGYDFTVFTREDLPGWTTNYVASLAASEDGTLWAFSRQAELVRRKNGAFESFGTQEGLPGEPASTLLQACAGAVWMSTQGGLVRVSDEDLTVYATGDELPGRHIAGMGCDPEGHLVASVKGGALVTYRDGRFYPYTPDRALAEPGSCHGLPAPACPRNTVKDRDGVLWVGTREGLVRKGQGTTTVYTTACIDRRQG